MNSTCRVLAMVEEDQDPRVMGQAVSLPVTRCGGGSGHGVNPLPLLCLAVAWCSAVVSVVLATSPTMPGMLKDSGDHP